MLKRGGALLAIVLILSFSEELKAQDYSKEMKNMLKGVFKVDYGKYQFFGIPISNFGIGTMYPSEAQGKNFDVKTAGLYGDPNTWWANVSDGDKAGAIKAIFPSGKSGSVNLSGKKTKAISLSVVVPALFKIVSGSGSIDWNRATTVTLTADTAENHLMNWTELDDAVYEKKLIKDSVVRHFRAHDFLITVGDIVLYGLNAHVAVSKSTDAKAAAQLNQAAANLGKDSKLNFEYKSNLDGTFDLKSKDPVVAAVYIAVPPPGALRAVTPTDLTVIFNSKLLQDLQDAEKNHIAIPEN